MKLHIKNCVTDPRFKELRKNGTPVFKPVISGSVLLPGAVRLVLASDLNKSEVLFIDSLLKSGCCLVNIMGQGPINSMDTVLNYLGFSEEEVVKVKEPAPKIEELVIEEEVQEEPEEIQEEIQEETKEEESEEDLLALKNSDLREMILAIDPDASVGNKSKKKLVSLLLELKNG